VKNADKKEKLWMSRLQKENSRKAGAGLGRSSAGSNDNSGGVLDLQ